MDSYLWLRVGLVLRSTIHELEEFLFGGAPAELSRDDGRGADIPLLVHTWRAAMLPGEELHQVVRIECRRDVLDGLDR